MSAVPTPADPVDVLRVPPIAADLLPAEILQSRRGRLVRGVVLVVLVGFMVLLGAWYGVARHQTSVAQRGLDSAEDDAQQLRREQSTYSELITVQTASEKIKDQLATLLANDVGWSQLVARAQRAAPSGVRLTALNGLLAAPSDARSSLVSDLPNTAGAPAIGTLTVTGVGADKPVVAAYIDTLAELRGLGNVLLSDVSQTDDGVSFTVRLDITGQALTGRYAAEATGADRND